jgi:hypothetical protein
MADGDGSSGSISGSVGEIIKDVADFTGDTLKEGFETTFSAPSGNPQQAQQQQAKKQQTKQQEAADANQVRAWLKKMEQDQKEVISQNKQKEMQRTQEQKQDDQKKEQIKQYKTQAKAPDEAIARSRSEMKAGHGVGG